MDHGTMFILRFIQVWRSSLSQSTLRLTNFVKGGFSLKTHQMFSVHATPKKVEHGTITGHLDLRLRKTQAGNSHDCFNVTQTSLS